MEKEKKNPPLQFTFPFYLVARLYGVVFGCVYASWILCFIGAHFRFKLRAIGVYVNVMRF